MYLRSTAFLATTIHTGTVSPCSPHCMPCVIHCVFAMGLACRCNKKLSVRVIMQLLLFITKENCMLEQQKCTWFVCVSDLFYLLLKGNWHRQHLTVTAKCRAAKPQPNISFKENGDKHCSYNIQSTHIESRYVFQSSFSKKCLYSNTSTVTMLYYLCFPINITLKYF